MKKFLLLLAYISVAAYAMAQPSWFYSGTRQLNEDQLKKVLNDKINGRVELSEEAVRELSKKYSQSGNSGDNVLLFYSKTTKKKMEVSPDQAESWSVADYLKQKQGKTDVLDIRQIEKGSLSGRTQTVTASSVQAQNQVFKGGQLVKQFSMLSDSLKGEIARMVFYNELQKGNPNVVTSTKEDLKIADGFSSEDWQTLLEWNKNYPPNARELQLNKNSYNVQNTRNPFVDNPDFANRIWGGGSNNNISFGNLQQNPQIPSKSDTVDISAPIFVESGIVNQVTLTYGLTYDANTYSQSMEEKNQLYSAKLRLTGIEETETMFYRIVAVSDSDTNSISSDFVVPKDIKPNEISNVADIQGQGVSTDMLGEHTYVSGRVTGNMNRVWYLQSGNQKRNAIAVEGNLFRGQVGDSVIVGGTVVEKNGVTSLSDLTYTFNYHQPVPYRPLELTIREVKSNPEDYESMLIKIPDVKFLTDKAKLPKAGTKTMVSSVKNGEYSINIKIDSAVDLSGKSFPHGVVDVQGILSEEGNEYFIVPRTFGDLNVSRDTMAPKITDYSFDKTTAILRVKYSEPMDPVSVNDPASYTFGSETTRVEYARLDEDKRVATILLSGVPEKELTFSPNRVEDAAGNRVGSVEYSVKIPESNKDFDFPVMGDEYVQVSKNAFKHDELSIKSKDTEISKIEIFSMVGDKLKEYAVDAYNTTIDIKALKKGMYIADITLDNDSKVSRKFVKD